MLTKWKPKKIYKHVFVLKCIFLGHFIKYKKFIAEEYLTIAYMFPDFDYRYLKSL